MAVTAYNGPPGSGKSHALVKDVILSAVFAGRRVLSNIDGLNPDAIKAYCLERPDQWQVENPDELGEVVLFHGSDAQQPGFWATEETQKNGTETVVKAGDLVAFDEWAMFFPPGDKSQAALELEAFMRWHRHLTHPVTGVACDLAIATQSITDLSRRHRPLLTRSYLFKNLAAVGARGQYTWHAFDGRLQKSSYRTGHGTYDKAVFPLYASSAAATAGNHTELRTNRKETIWTGWRAWAVVVGSPAALIIGGLSLWWLYSGFMHPEAAKAAATASGAPASSGGPPSAPAGPPAPTPSPWRIVGYLEGDTGTRVIVADEKGAVRVMSPDKFEFDNGRPVAGMIDGRQAIAEERLPVSSSSPLLGAIQ